MQKHVQTGVPFHKNLTTDAFSSFGRKSRYVWILSLRQRRWPNSCLLDGAGQEAEAVRRRAPRRRDPVAAICAATGWTPGCSGWWRCAALDTSQGLSHRIPATIVSGTCILCGARDFYNILVLTIFDHVMGFIQHGYRICEWAIFHIYCLPLFWGEHHVSIPRLEVYSDGESRSPWSRKVPRAKRLRNAAWQTQQVGLYENWLYPQGLMGW